jgi:DNA polymerase-3 subunit epsilon
MRRFFDTPMASAPLALLDTETTGFDPREGHRVITLCVIHARLDQPQSQWRVVLDVQLDPERSVPPGAARVNGYTDEVIAELRQKGQLQRFADVEAQLDQALKGRIAVAYNLPFDASFIVFERATAKGLRSALPRDWRPPGLDPRLLAPLVWPGERQRLVDCAARAGCALPDAHTARADALMAGLVLRDLLQRLARDGRAVSTVRDVVELQESSREEVEAEYRARRA